MPTSDDQFERLANRALSVNPKAMRICPWCRYQLEGLLKDGKAQPCPECGEEVSGIINLTVWGKRTRWIPLFKLIIVGWTPFVVVWAFIVVGIMIGASRGLSEPAEGWFYDMLMLSIPTLVLAMPFVVFASCYRWMYLRNPTRAAGTRLMVSIGVVMGNIVVMLLFMFVFR